MSALPPKADMCGATRDVRFGPEADIGALDICHCRTNLLFVGLDRSRPAYPRHFAQALHFSPPAGPRTFGEMSDFLSLLSGCGTGFRAFDNRPVSCRAQPSVVSTPKEMRYVLR